MPYIANTDSDRRKMLDKIGVSSFDELLKTIPETLRLNKPLNINALSEMELLNEIKEISSHNNAGLTCFAGGGVYDHFIPSLLKALINRPEFMTAYTPYQAEVAQGTLQVIYEFQTHICRLTGMDVANASMYDGASAAAEAVAISSAVTKRKKVLIAETVSPLYREVINTYLSAQDVELINLPMDEGRIDPDELKKQLNDEIASVLLAQPNFFGELEDIDEMTDAIHAVGAKLIMAVDPIAQALLKTPGEYGADIVVGEGQPLGIPLSFGGPLVGFFAAKKELVRSLPGRIAARTVDVDGKTGFVLTLQTREQHIRREKATSNICTNQALCATAATIYVSLLGKTGLKKVALLSTENAQRIKKELRNIDGFEPYFKNSATVREFAIRTPKPAEEIILEFVERFKILPGIDAGRWYKGMDDCLIIATTETKSSEQIEKLMGGFKQMASSHVLSGM